MRSGHADAVRFLTAAGGRHGANIDWNRHPDLPSSDEPSVGCSPRADFDLHRLSHHHTTPVKYRNRNNGVSSVLMVDCTPPRTMASRPQFDRDYLTGALALPTGTSTQSARLMEFEKPSSTSKGKLQVHIPAMTDFPDASGARVGLPGESEAGRSSPGPMTPGTSERLSCKQGVYFLPDGTAEWELLPMDVVVSDVIGEGAFGEIRSGRWRGCPVAIKTLKSDCMMDEIAVKEFNSEMSIWCRLV